MGRRRDDPGGTEGRRTPGVKGGGEVEEAEEMGVGTVEIIVKTNNADTDNERTGNTGA